MFLAYLDLLNSTKCSGQTVKKYILQTILDQMAKTVLLWTPTFEFIKDFLPLLVVPELYEALKHSSWVVGKSNLEEDKNDCD